MRAIPVVKISVILLFTCWLCFIYSCKKEEDPQPEDPQAVAMQKLTSGTWSLNSATRDGINVTNDFSSFTVRFTSSGYTTTNGTGAWETSGTWNWANAEGTQITLDNGAVVQISFTNNDTELQLSFTLTETSYDIGKLASIAGNYIFILSR